MQLSKNENFLREFRDFSSKIERVTDEGIKKELSALLNKLMLEVKAIDKQHEDMFIGNKMMDSITDHRESLLNIRKKIAAKLEDCQRAKLIS
jgi:predicted component of type VI protein secretion system